jgi:four helix bundle protein
MAESFRLLEVARLVADEVNVLLRPRNRLIHRPQLRDSSQSVPANIREGMGKDPGPDRNKSYRDARGSAEETDEHLRANFADGRLQRQTYQRLHNRLVVAIKMIDENLAK